MRLLQKFLTRDAPLIAMEKWYEGLMVENKKFFGLESPENVFIFRQGTVDFYRDSERNNKELPIELSKWVKSNRDKIDITYQSLVDGLKLIEIIKKEDLNLKDNISDDLVKIGDAFAGGFKGIITTFWFPIWQDSFKKQGIELFNEDLIKEVRDWRAKTESFFDASVDTIFLLINKIAELKNWDKNLIKFISYAELMKALQENELPIVELEKRRNNIFAYIQSEIIFEKDIEAKLMAIDFELEEEEFSKDIKELKGSIANKGVVKGIVKVIFSREQINKVEDGDILIAPMTTPWYLPAMKKAVGFVTDEGGVTCHAAIVAREMNKPCIIGTKIATQVLKDGMKVEVDADQGIVKILT